LFRKAPRVKPRVVGQSRSRLQSSDRCATSRPFRFVLLAPPSPPPAARVGSNLVLTATPASPDQLELSPTFPRPGVTVPTIRRTALIHDGSGGAIPSRSRCRRTLRTKPCTIATDCQSLVVSIRPSHRHLAFLADSTRPVQRPSRPQHPPAGDSAQLQTAPNASAWQSEWCWALQKPPIRTDLVPFNRHRALDTLLPLCPISAPRPSTQALFL